MSKWVTLDITIISTPTINLPKLNSMCGPIIRKVKVFKPIMMLFIRDLWIIKLVKKSKLYLKGSRYMRAAL